jgi:hypothetical protein
MLGGQGNDALIFDVGQASGDTVMDLQRRGGRGLVGLRRLGPGATFTNIDTTHSQVNYNGGASHEVITFSNAASVDASDFIFI